MIVEPVTLDGRLVRLESLAAEHAEALAEAATPTLFAYHFPPTGSLSRRIPRAG